VSLVNLDELTGPEYHELSGMQAAWVREGEGFRPVLLRATLKLTAVVDEPDADHRGPSPKAELLRKELVYLEPAGAHWTPTQHSTMVASRARARGNASQRAKLTRDLMR
jgi:hypothetical protein